jgi:hypothetical protein
LFAIRQAAVIFPPRRLLRIAEQIIAADTVVVPDLGSAHTAEKFLGRVGAAPSID